MADVRTTRFELEGFRGRQVQSIRTKLEPEAVIIELGTNDAQHELSDCIDNFIDQAMAPIMDGLDSSTPVYWLTVREDIHPPFAATINAKLREATARWSNLTILDYDAHFRPRCDKWCDGVHLTAAGEVEHAQWLVGKLDARFPAPTTTSTSTTTTTTSTTSTTTTSTTSTTTTSTTSTTTTSTSIP